METVVGVFPSRDDAMRAARHLRREGSQEINLLMPGATDGEIHAVPLSATEQPGMGKAIGGVVGGALGAAGGLELGALAASGFMTGVGPVVAIGIAAAAILGATGSVIGAAGGSALEEKADSGLPEDEWFVYQDALRKGRSVLFVQSNGKNADRARAILEQAGSESIDAAREAWWIGLRSAEQEHYQATGGNLERDEAAYRAGFEAAVRYMKPELVRQQISRCATAADQEAFRRGYERGREYAATEFQKSDREIDEASEESFPASDPPSR